MPSQRQEENGYTECVIAFIDILGFSKLVERSAKTPGSLDVLTRALNAIAALPSGFKATWHPSGRGGMVERTWKVQTRPFSDSMVIFMPKETDSIAQVLFMVRYLHDRMLELELCTRGAVTIGGMYWNDAWSNPEAHPQPTEHGRDPLCGRGGNQGLPITLGPGFIDAHNLESKCAIYPRIIISRTLFTYIEEQDISSSPLGQTHPPNCLLKHFIRQDVDGLRFLDVLHPDIVRSDPESIERSDLGDTFSITWHQDSRSNYNAIMEKVQALILKWSDNDDEKIGAKYGWLDSYARQHTQRT